MCVRVCACALSPSWPQVEAERQRDSVCVCVCVCVCSHLLGLQVEADPGADAGESADDEEAVAPGQEVHVGTRHPLPVLTHLREHRGADKRDHRCKEKARCHRNVKQFSH